MVCKLICCEVFLREACLAVATSPNTVDLEFTPKDAHENADELRDILQKKIDDSESYRQYDAILLGYGLCGNSTAGLKARNIPLVIPRAHDCCTIFLGSKEKFKIHFKDKLSAKWNSAGYMERKENGIFRESSVPDMLGINKSYEELVEKYGDENAKYIWETLHPEEKEYFFIDVPEFSHLGYLDKMREIAEEENKKLTVIEGDMRLIRGLVNGEWNSDEYLVIPPGKEIVPIYDMDIILDAE